METSFRKSLLHSFIFHVVLVLVLFLIYGNFLVRRTPLLMELTLIGQMSQGYGMGSNTSHTGEIPSQMPVAATDGEFSTPQKPMANPPVANTERPEVSIKKPLKSNPHPGKSAAEAYLESLRQSAPIGLNPKKNVTKDVKTTAGLGHIGVAGTPDGSANIEGELAARNVKRQINPLYPEWARKQGIEATVKFHLTVLPNGLLKESDLQVEQTSGYRELDRVVYDALVQWEFDPLPPEIPAIDQSGVITFSFSLK